MNPFKLLTLPFRQQPLPRHSNPSQLNETYTTELIEFLQQFGALHRSHPEDFFSSSFLQRKENEAKQSSAFGSGTDEDEFDLRQWCQVMSELLTNDGDERAEGNNVNVDSLLSLLDLGSHPSSSSSSSSSYGSSEEEASPQTGVWSALSQKNPALYKFTEDCLRLRLRRTPESAAAVTAQRAEQKEKKRTPGCTDEVEEQKPAAEGEEARLEKLLSYGMSVKKKHEAQQMFRAIMSLLREGDNGGGGHHQEEQHRAVENVRGCSVSAVVNVGEGKGYVSRVLALAGGLPVVGLDCNPNHRDTSFERSDRTLYSKIDDDGDSFLYVRRGETVSVTCRVGRDLDWERVLPSRVRMGSSRPSTEFVSCADEAMDTASTKRPRDFDGGTEEQHQHQQRLHIGASTVSDGVEVGKVKCIVCGRISVANPSLLIAHYQGAHSTQASSSEPSSSSALDLTNVAVRQRWLAERFVPFVPTQQTPPHTAAASSAATTQFSSSNVGLGATGAPQRRYARGCRLMVPSLIFSSKSRKKNSQESSRTEEAEGESRQQELVETPTQPNGSKGDGEEEVVTVLGFNDSDQRYRVLRHKTKQRLSVLLSLPSSAAGEVNCTAEATTTGNSGVVRVVPPVAPIPPQISLNPPLVNTLMIGLHTCGDLGANICRLWLRSQSPKLLLVSCCWHAVTEQGFPLSSFVSQFGVKMNILSLMLATQPVMDKMERCNVAGYLGSKKLLFYRALLPLLLLPEENSNTGPIPSPKLPLPTNYDTLSPAFLRKVAKKKETLSFVEFVEDVAADCLLREKQTKDEASRSTSRLSDTEIEELMNGLRRKAATLTSQYGAQSFASFLGFVILRMWIAPLVETLLLLDRALFLSEGLASTSIPLEEERRGSSNWSGTPSPSSSVEMVPLFDPILSPRNYALLVRR